MKTVIIPARIKYSRFPGMPLIPLLGKNMILWGGAELSARALPKKAAYIACEDEHIAKVLADAGLMP